MNRTTKLTVSFGAGALLALSANALTTDTKVNDLWGANGTGPGPEWNLFNSGFGTHLGNGVLEYLYGAGNFTRVSDSVDSPWSGVNGTMRLNAIYTADNDSLFTAGVSGTPVSSAIVSGGPASSGTPSRGSTVSTFLPINQPFLFMLQPSPTSPVYPGVREYSDAALNTFDGAQDHMVTFAVNGYLATPGVAGSFTSFTDGPHYVLGFEDGVDFDFNDLVVEVSGVSPGTHNDTPPGVPDGGSTLALLGGALSLMAAIGRRFRK